MAETMEMEMEFSDGEETKVVAHVPATSVPPFYVPAYDGAAVVAAHGNSVGALQKGKERDSHEHLPGYIFMCNGKTKSECYRYRVFGLPKGRKDIAENIKPGMKLFLYDFERKLLYGTYEATIGGKLNIEPDAFDRKFPAQVGFRIVKNCYPLPESTFKPAIQQNYKGAKFKQELTPHQVAILLSLFRSFTAPELDSVPPRLAPGAAPSEAELLGLENQFHPRTRVLSFEERYIAARQHKLASSVSDPLSVHHTVPWRHSMVPKFVAHSTSSVHHSYSRQTNYMNPPREPLSVSNLNKQYYPSETQQQRLLRDPSELSMQDPQLRYLTILSNIRRYGADPGHSASENEYYPPTSSGLEHYASTPSGNGYYPSTSSGNELPSISSVSGSVYYPSTSSANEFYTLASQKEGETGRQPEIPSTEYYNQQASAASNATMSAQSDMHAVGNVSQSHVETSGYPPLTHGQAVVSAQQPPAEAIGYALPQPYAGAIGYTPQPQAGAMEDNALSYAGATGYAQPQHAGMIPYAPQLYAGATGYTLQPHAGAIGYATQMDAEAVGCAQQPVETQTALAGASGTINWDVSNRFYSGTTDWNAVNQCYYSYAAGATTSSYNQTC